jgi:hypothetical protein
MVEVYQSNPADHLAYGGGAPLVHIHSIRREVFGNEISLWVAGEMKIAAKEVVFAKELKLNSIQVLVLTPEAADHVPYIVNKWIYHKGLYDNYASIDIFAPTAGYELRTLTGDRQAQVPTPTIGATSILPYDGSLWLNFIAVGDA